MVSERFQGNQPNGFPPGLVSGNIVGEICAEDEGVTATIARAISIGQVLGYRSVPVNVVTVQMGKKTSGQRSAPGPPSRAFRSRSGFGTNEWEE